MPRQLLSLLFFAVLSLPSQAFDVPRLKQPVMDQAGLLQSRSVSQLNTLLKQYRKQTGVQIAILTVPDLQGEVIEQASIQVADQWKLGDRDKDNGLLILLAKKERKIRIEVGQGLEGDIPDAYAKRVIDNIMTPHFKQGDFLRGLYFGIARLSELATPKTPIGNVQGQQKSSWKREKKRGFGLKDIIVMILFLFFFVLGGRSPFLALLLGHSLGRSSRSYGGGGSFGGGGFSGGGGGFSGGGASGGW